MPSDFPLAPLRDRDLATLAGDVEDVLPLTPVQQLYYTLETARPGSGIDQWHWTLTGNVDPAALSEAWEHASDLHPVTPHRVSRQAGSWRRCRLCVRTAPFRWSDPHRGRERVSPILKSDRATGLTIDQAPLMRLTLVQMPGADDRDSSGRITTCRSTGGRGRCCWRKCRRRIGPSPTVAALARCAARRSGTTCSGINGRTLSASRQFWQQYLRRIHRPTPVSQQSRGTAVFHEQSATLNEETTTQLVALARR